MSGELCTVPVAAFGTLTGAAGAWLTTGAFGGVKTETPSGIGRPPPMRGRIGACRRGCKVLSGGALQVVRCAPVAPTPASMSTDFRRRIDVAA
jgi:hypothetical protein